MNRKTTVVILALCLPRGSLLRRSADGDLETKRGQVEARSRNGQEQHALSTRPHGDNIESHWWMERDAQGKPTHNEWVGKFDGKDYPVTGDPNSDMRSYTASGRPHPWTSPQRRHGKVTTTVKVAVSADGKRARSTMHGTEPDGKKFHSIGRMIGSNRSDDPKSVLRWRPSHSSSRGGPGQNRRCKESYQRPVGYPQAGRGDLGVSVPGCFGGAPPLGHTASITAALRASGSTPAGRYG